MKRVVGSEEYFTPLDLARRCIDLVAAHYPLGDFDVIVEPGAGAGPFLDLLPATTRIGLDIEPRHPGVIQADFLAWSPPGGRGRVLTIGNPPFGQRAALAVAFLRHACAFSDVVAFILPRSFRKYTFANRVPREFHLVDSLDCDAFVRPDGAAVEVRAVFQVWERRPELRELVVPPASHPHFAMRHAHLSRVSPAQLETLRRDYEFTVPQVGADFRPRSVAEVTRGSHWFIRPHVPGVRDRFARLDFSFLDGMNTAHMSLSKRDIVAAYVAVMDGRGHRLTPPDGPANLAATRSPSGAGQA